MDRTITVRLDVAEFDKLRANREGIIVRHDHWRHEFMAGWKLLVFATVNNLTTGGRFGATITKVTPFDSDSSALLHVTLI